ncbi:MAG: hypothetical protein ACE5F7_03110 [Nitrospiria bacterium]
MHAAFPCFTQGIHMTLRRGAKTGGLPEALEAAGGTLIASGMALLLKAGFGYVMRDGLLDKRRSEEALRFFRDNFVFTDPGSPGGERYYQGKFLIRTRKPGDNMNVYLSFCPKPEELFIETPFGSCLNPMSVVSTKILDEERADRIEKSPDRVDLIIRFRDNAAILELMGKADVDIVGLLLDNVVQLTGNVGHLFKLGAIAAETETALGLSQ